MYYVYIFLQLALTAGSPIYRGYLANVDCRWDVIAAAVDDRTPGERGLEVILMLQFAHISNLRCRSINSNC